jgi:RNA polymerase sigma-70 factor (ECF subfamily)
MYEDGGIVSLLAPATENTRDLVPQAAPPLPDFRSLYDDHAAFVWRSLRRLGVPPAHVEDACQEAFVVVHKKLSEFDGTSPRGWLFAIAVRVAADFRKRAHVRREAYGAEVAAAVTSAPQHAELERQRTREFLQRVLDDLDDEKRSVFVLYELEGMPMAEIAEILGCPLQTAYSRLHAARRKVQDAVERAKSQGEWP